MSTEARRSPGATTPSAENPILSSFIPVFRTVTKFVTNGNETLTGLLTESESGPGTSLAADDVTYGIPEI